MATAMVAARVSRAKRDACLAVLADIGSTPTDLVNAAFDYCIANHALPGEGDIGAKRKSAGEFAQFVQKSTLKVSWPSGLDAGDYKTIIREGRTGDYESIA